MTCSCTAAIDWDSRFWSKVHPEALSGCWLWHGHVSPLGYGRFNVGSGAGGARRMILAHRHAWELVKGTIPPGMVVRHKCDVPSCVNPDHIELGTVADNNRDMVERGRQARGERNGSAKLTLAQVNEIRAKYAGSDRTQSSLAAEYRVDPSQVSRAVSGKTWSHAANADTAAADVSVIVAGRRERRAARLGHIAEVAAGMRAGLDVREALQRADEVARQRERVLAEHERRGVS